jgi:hypothetical protein
MTITRIISLALVTAAILVVPSDVLAQHTHPAGVTVTLHLPDATSVTLESGGDHPVCTVHHAWRDALKFSALGFVAITFMPLRADNGRYLQQVRLIATGAGLLGGTIYGHLRDDQECRSPDVRRHRTVPEAK